MAFAAKEDLEKVIVYIDSIKIRMIDHTQEMTDKRHTLKTETHELIEKIGSEQTEPSEKIERDQAGMKYSHTRLILKFNELQGKGERAGHQVYFDEQHHGFQR